MNYPFKKYPHSAAAHPYVLSCPIFKFTRDTMTVDFELSTNNIAPFLEKNRNHP